MKRKELEAKAFEAIKNNMEYIGYSDEEILDEIRNSTNEQIQYFISEL